MSNSSDISNERYEEIRKEVLQSIFKFCSHELQSDALDSDQKESLMVAKQCLETAYDCEEASAENATDLIQLFNSNNIPIPAANAAELEAEAETYKIQGNDAMKENNYAMAVEHYTKAIKLYNKKAIYYCNRAAAYSRMEKHNEAVADCKAAIKLDPSYGKAYGRLGIAYSNMNMYQRAADAYRKALELDSSNASYESNLRLAEEKIASGGGGGAGPAGFGGFDFGGIMNNPALLNMASQMLNDPSFRNVGQQLAEQMQQSNPGLIDNIRESLSRVQPNADPNAPQGEDASKNAGNKDDAPNN